MSNPTYLWLEMKSADFVTDECAFKMMGGEPVAAGFYLALRVPDWATAEDILERLRAADMTSGEQP